MNKKLKLFATAVLCFANFAIQAQSSFVGDGYYRIKNKENPTNYMAYGTPTDTDGNILLSTDNTGDETIFHVVENMNVLQPNLFKYNIHTGDDVRYINAVKGNSVLSRKPNANNSLIDDIALFQIKQISIPSDTYNISVMYTPKDNAGNATGDPAVEKFLIYDTNDDTNISDVGVYTSGGNATAKWVFEPVETLSVNGVQKSTNAVYPVPSTDGIFYLQNETAWSVYTITGTLIAKGDSATIDLSNAPKGFYILQYNGKSTKIIFQ